MTGVVVKFVPLTEPQIQAFIAQAGECPRRYCECSKDHSRRALYDAWRKYEYQAIRELLVDTDERLLTLMSHQI